MEQNFQQLKHALEAVEQKLGKPLVEESNAGPKANTAGAPASLDTSGPEFKYMKELREKLATTPETPLDFLRQAQAVAASDPSNEDEAWKQLLDKSKEWVKNASPEELTKLQHSLKDVLEPIPRDQLISDTIERASLGSERVKGMGLIGLFAHLRPTNK